METSSLPAAVPRPRQPQDAPSAVTGATVVLPYVSSRAAARTRRLRAWMLTAPVDLSALLAPLLIIDGYWRASLSAAALTMVLFASGGFYRARRHLSLLDELPGLCGRVLAAAAVVAVIAAARHASVGYGADFMRGVGISAALVVAGRAATRAVVLVARRRRWVERTAIVLGSGPVAVELARLLRRYPQYGLRFAGLVDVASSPRGPLLGTLDRLGELVALVHCDVLVVADPDCTEATLMETVRQPECAGCEVWLVPRLWGSASQSGAPDHIGAIPVVQIRDTTLSGPRWAAKRASDVLFATVALVVLSPVLLACAVGTWVDGGRPVFFRQERVGRYGRPIRVVKFRTMHPRDSEEARTTWSIADDRRVSGFGRFLRRTSLDELPQLWNILRGDMTVVGPRPKVPRANRVSMAEYPEYAMRHRVPVGLTGLAQVSGLRGDTPISDRTRFDNYYIENWSLWLDVKVLLRTVAEVFRGGGR